MKPFARSHYTVGRYRIVVLTGDKDAFIRYVYTEDYPLDRHPNIVIYMAGSFRRFREDNTDDFLIMKAGETNDKVGDQPQGAYKLQALEDGTVHYCVSDRKGTRPIHSRVSLSRGEMFTLKQGELAVMFSGQILDGEDSHAHGDVIHATTKDIIFTANSDASFEHFQLATVN